ncbi:MAG: peroxide stress protein YaaA [Zetaproteobacteria bacterium]|nr:peroxide stress protein YaaA [Zetaproteobacteria bacterium]
MLMIISPAKKLAANLATSLPVTQPLLLDKSQQLIEILRTHNAVQIADLMKLSMNLADLNVQRYHDWHQPFTTDNASAALLMFQGDVYQGMDAASLDGDDMHFAQQHLRILSGLYGLLKPLDLMQAYRLEMGTRLRNARGENLYQFWGEIITQHLNTALHEQGDDTLINLASSEYFKVIQPKALQGSIITPHFKERKNDTYKIIGIHAKRARGLMARFIIKNRLQHPDAIKRFDLAGYRYNEALSSAHDWVFARG